MKLLPLELGRSNENELGGKESDSTSLIGDETPTLGVGEEQ
jgi:hypothetical protein